MKNHELERFSCYISPSKNDESLIVHLVKKDGSVSAKGIVNKVSRAFKFSDATGHGPLTNAVPLEDGTYDVEKYMNRSLCVNGQADGVILNAAYQYVLQTQTVNVQEPIVETENFDIILTSQFADPLTPSGKTSRSKSGSHLPKRRKTKSAIWI